MKERQSYRPNKRLGAIARAKAFKRSYAVENSRKPFATEQKPGSGGFKLGSAAVYQRQQEAGDRKRRAESFRPENAVSSEVYDKLAT